MKTKNVVQLDANGYFVGLTEADESPLEPGVWLIPAGAVDAEAPNNPVGYKAKWNGSGFELEAIPVEPEPEPTPEPEPLTQRQLDELRYQKRASVKDQLIAYMAADNMQRVRNGEWTVQNLTSLMQDPALQAAQGFMQTLSFELAAQAISQSDHALMTEEIKSNWINKLQENFYLIP